MSCLNTQIEELTVEKEIFLKDFIENSNSSKIQHSIEFKKALEKTYRNCKGKYYTLVKAGQIVALFPFFIVKSKLFGNRATSLPFLDVGGFLGDYDKNDLNKLINVVKAAYNENGLKFIEVRTNSFITNFERDREWLLDLGFLEDSSKQQIITELTNEEDIWKRFHKHTRNDIRKAENSNLKLIRIKDKIEIKRFYKLYFTEMKNFGTPPHSLRFFNNVFNAMSEKSIGFNCYHNKQLIASLILFYQNKYAYVAFNVSNPKYRSLKPNDFLYWEAIKWALRNKIKYLDIGQIETNTDKNSRAYRLYKFKSKWLGDIYQRSYFYYHTKPSKESISEKQSEYKRFRKIWTMLPGFIIKLIGPKICAQLGV